MSATSWTAVLVGCGLCYLAKVLGWAAPAHWLEHPRVVRVTGLLTVALLTALLAVQTVADGRSLVVDARLAAVGVAAAALWFRAPFLVVVLLAGATAALLRALQ